MSDWATDKAWADTCQEAAVEILRRHAFLFATFAVAPEQLDRRQATDFVVTTDRGKVAWRARRPGTRYRDLTLRYRRRRNRRAAWERNFEADKIIRGYAEAYLYTWVLDA